MITISKEAQKLVNEYNKCNAINSFLYSNQGSEELMAKVLKLDKVDRFEFVNRMNQISHQLNPYIHENFHNKKVITPNKHIGIIQHPLTREYNGMTFDNEAKFLGYTRSIPDEIMKIEPEVLAMEIVIEGYPLEHHYYPINCLTLIEE